MEYKDTTKVKCMAKGCYNMVEADTGKETLILCVNCKELLGGKKK